MTSKKILGRNKDKSIKYRTLAYKSLIHYWRTNITVFLGVLVSTAVLTGALVVGDSVRFSLKRLALTRLGGTEYAMAAGDRFFRTRLAEDIADRVFEKTASNAETAPVIQLGGIAVTEGGLYRANGIQVLGVDRRFWALGRSAALSFGRNSDFSLGPDEAVVNRYLASRLNLKEGDSFLIRVENPGSIPGDTPISSDRGSDIALRLTVKAIAGDHEFGRFSLRANQAAALNVYLSLSWLGKKINMEDRANLILISGIKGAKKGKVQSTLSVETLNSLLKETWTLSDTGLELHVLPEINKIELTSTRIFLDPPAAQAAYKTGADPEGILTYFVNAIHSGKNSTPYSFVSAPGIPIVPDDMSDDEIIINEWLSDDIGIVPGHYVSLTYYIPGHRNSLEEKTKTFKVRSVVPIEGPASDRHLMPQFQGIADVANCRDWDPGIPIDLDKIRKKDELYWNVYKGTPKAFLTLNAAQEMWKNRFGNLTAVRYKIPGKYISEEHISGEYIFEEYLEEYIEEISSGLLNNLDPGSLGFQFLPVREQGVNAGMGAVDFGQLFLGLSIFIIMAALLLTGLLFVFGLENRNDETNLLFALGIPKFRARSLYIIEGTIIAVLGSIPGIALGVFYNQILLRGLSTIWQGAVGTSDLMIHIKVSSILTGMFSGIAMAVFSMWVATGKLSSRYNTSSKRAGFRFSDAIRTHKKSIHAKSNLGLWSSLAVTAVCLICATAILLSQSPGKGQENPGLFFITGALLLAAAIGVCNTALVVSGGSIKKGIAGIAGMGLKNISRRRGRSLATIALLACGIFIVAAVGVNRNDTIKNPDRRSSGTGGFTFYGETTLPVLYDLNSEQGRRNFRLYGIDKEGVRFVQLRVHDGDDASCLNLNRIENPRILGIDPEELATRGSFSFVKTIDSADGDNPWLLLKKEIGSDIIPAIADQTVMTWGLKKSVGDTIYYTDERGKEFKIKLVGGLSNSIFQGNILISEKAFLERFPSTSGSRVFLIDLPKDFSEKNSEQISEKLLRAFRDLGLELLPAAERLLDFNTVQNTYLSIFLFLGGLGLILGSFGIGIVVLRNTLEMRGELALLRAVGWKRRSLTWILLAEHLPLLAAGLACGTAAAITAAVPVLYSPGRDLPFLFMVVILGAIAVFGTLWTYFAVKLVSRGDLLPALRKE
jgi:putative ABC transport system permease protein